MPATKPFTTVPRQSPWSPSQALDEVFDSAIADFDFPDETRALIENRASRQSKGLEEALLGIELLLSAPVDDDTVISLIEWGGGKILDEPKSESAKQFLVELAEIIRNAVAKAR